MVVSKMHLHTMQACVFEEARKVPISCARRMSAYQVSTCIQGQEETNEAGVLLTALTFPKHLLIHQKSCPSCEYSKNVLGQ